MTTHVNISKEERDILTHALKEGSNRNYCHTGPGAADYPVVLRLVEYGFMAERMSPGALPGVYGATGIYRVTEAGAIVVGLRIRK